MDSGRFKSKNSTAIYLIAIIIIIVAFLLLGGGPWARGIIHGPGIGHGGMMHRNCSLNMANWNWLTIFISMGIGFVLGILFARRK